MAMHRHPASNTATLPAGRAPARARALVVLLALGATLSAGAQKTAGEGAASPPASSAAPYDTGPSPAPYSAAVAARFADPGVRYRTPGLSSGRDRFTSNAELAQALHRLADRPVNNGPGVRPRLLQAGRSQLGQPLWALHFSTGSAPGAAAKPAVLVVAQQHGNEPAGAEALLVLAQQLAGGEFTPVLQQVDVVLLPRANPDAIPDAEPDAGPDRAQTTRAPARATTRVSASGHDINRDHLLLHTPEARAIAALMQRLQPLVVVDVHEYLAVGRWRSSFGAEARHDLLLQVATTALADPAWQSLSTQLLAQPALLALAEQGLRGEWYHENFSHFGAAGLQRRLRMGSVQPDVARNVLGLRHAASLLLESRGIGIGHQHIQRRVHSLLVALHAVLENSARNVPALLALRERTRADAVAQACQNPAAMVTVLAAHRDSSRDLLFLHPETGADLPLQVPWEDALQRVDVTRRTRPCGYWLAADAGEAVTRLQRLGLQVQRLAQSTPLQVESWVEQAPLEPTPAAAAEPTAPEISNRLRRARVQLQAHRLQAPAGSWWLPLSQPLAALAIAALEPDTPSSYFANRVLPLLGSAARVMVLPAGPLEGSASAPAQ